MFRVQVRSNFDLTVPDVHSTRLEWDGWRWVGLGGGGGGGRGRVGEVVTVS